MKKLLPAPALEPPFFVLEKKPKPSQKPHRRHNSLLVVLFLLFKNCVASQAENSYQTGKTILQPVTRYLRLDKLVHNYRVGACVEGASSAGTKRVTPERA